MRVFVTGIEGFVGAHLARYLQERGDEVYGTHYASVQEELPATLFPCDINDFNAIKRALEESRPDWLIHLAGISSVAEAEKNPIPTYQVNTLGTLKLLIAVHQLMLPCRILLISSADVYGRGDKPHSETDPLQPLTAYARSKYLAEEIARLYYQTWDMDIVILRPFSHTGPGQADRFVFARVASHIAKVEQGKAPPILEMGDLEVRRDYTDVRDIVRAYIFALENCPAGETYNVTSGRPVRLRDGVEILLRLARKNIEIRQGVIEKRPYDIPFLSGNPEKFHRATGWTAQIPLEKTLSDLLEYYRSR
ncbi:NAD-dependent epimerase/dehydratase family protein [candidate division WOR-3 bacterium]|nr:NAD-dependent epimerase/dehydratase family protein [candidate division WOR-3 bacterium]